MFGRLGDSAAVGAPRRKSVEAELINRVTSAAVVGVRLIRNRIGADSKQGILIGRSHSATDWWFSDWLESS